MKHRFQPVWDTTTLTTISTTQKMSQKQPSPDLEVMQLKHHQLAERGALAGGWYAMPGRPCVCPLQRVVRCNSRAACDQGVHVLELEVRQGAAQLGVQLCRRLRTAGMVDRMQQRELILFAVMSGNTWCSLVCGSGVLVCDL